MSNFNNNNNDFGDSTMRGSNNFDPSNVRSDDQQGLGAGADGTNVLGSGPTDSYGSRQTGNAGTFGQDSLSSGGLDGTRPSGARGDAAGFDDAGLGNNTASNAYDNSSTTANTGHRGVNSGGGISGANPGQDIGGAGGFTGGNAGNSDFRDTTSGGRQAPKTGLNQGGDGGDSTVGKIMQKAGQVLNNEKLQQKGQQKRGNQGYDGSDVVSSATTGDRVY